MLEVFLSGICGAIASVLGKLAFSKTPFVEYLVYSCEINISYFTYEHCKHFSYGLRLSCLALMFYFNMLMFSFFMKALETKGSLPVTVVGNGTNFLITGIMSGLILGEKVNGRWYIGASVIAIGVCLIAISQHSRKRNAKSNGMDDPSALIDEEKDVLRILQSTSDDVMLSESVNQDSTVKEEEAIVDRIEYDEEDREGYTAIVAAGRKDEEILEGAAIGDVDVTDTQVTSDDDDDDDEDDGVVVHVSNSLPTRRLTMTKFTDRGQRSYVRPQLRDNSKVDVVEIIKKKEDDEIRALRFSQQRTAFDVDIDALDAHPWRKKNANLSDYFNYGFDEDSWKVYCEKQLRLRAAKGLGPFIPSLMTSAQSKPMSIVSLPPSTEYKVENKSMTPLIKTESFRPPPPSEVKNHPPKAPPPPGPHQPTFLDKPSQNHQTNQFNNNSIQATNFTMDGSYPFQQFPPNFQPSAPPIPMMFYPPNQPPMFPGGMIPGPPDNLEPSRYQSSDQDRRQRDDSRHRSRINQDSNYGDRDNYKIKYNENYKDSREIKRADSRPRERHRSGDRKVASTRKNRSRSRDKRR